MCVKIIEYFHCLLSVGDVEEEVFAEDYDDLGASVPPPVTQPMDTEVRVTRRMFLSNKM